VEEVERDLSGLSARERQALLENDAPELPALLADFTAYMAEVKVRATPPHFVLFWCAITDVVNPLTVNRTLRRTWPRSR
jgi:hypothetical protein